MEMAGGRRAFGTLDGMRGVAALCVLVFHASGLLLPFGLAGGYLAVDLFFLLSGFVIDHAYGARFAQGMGAAQFMRVRVVRLYPLYALGLALGIGLALAALAAGRGEFGPGQIAAVAGLSALLIPSHAPGQPAFLFAFNSPSWSLMLELFVNLAYALAFPRLTRRVLIAVILASGLALVVCVLAAGSANLGWDWPTLAGGVPRVTFSFFLGVALRRRTFGPGRTSHLGTLLPLALVPLFAVALGAAVRPLFDLACIGLFFPLMVTAAARHDPRGTAAAAAFRWLGWLSFAVYALHYPVIELFRRLGHAMHGLPAPEAGIAACALVLVASWIAARAYDAPARAVLARWLAPAGGRRAAGSPAVAAQQA